MNESILRAFEMDMRLANLSPETIKARIELVRRLAVWLEMVPLLNVTSEQMAGFQRRFANLAPASVDIYVRHLQAFYRWALGRSLIADDPSVVLIRPKLHKGRPHPTQPDDLRRIFACTTGPLRLAYVLAAFAGARRGEICRLQRADLDLASECPTALLDGKGGKQRIIPLLPPVIAELYDYGLPRTAWVLTRRNGSPYPPDVLSADSHWHLRGIGVETTLHSMRHAYATMAFRVTKDIVLVQRILGHESVSTTQVYADTDMANVHTRLDGLSKLGSSMLNNQTRLRAV